ncbi:MAG: hypothetical protein LIO86_13455 [Lachnospiraceae bacterium]|nr:hypothetical protein [Lachnospiraceae bacterium]
MTTSSLTLLETFGSAGFRWVLLDEEENSLRILLDASAKKDFLTLAKKQGWKKQKDRSGDIYLYGMDHYWYFLAGDCRLTVCFQLACCSTLNNGWVPLDKKINVGALDRSLDDVNRNLARHLAPADELCYLLAKCIYTDHQFSITDRERLEHDLLGANEPELSFKLSAVFFHFTPRLLELLRNRQYESIEQELWEFAEY